MAPVLVTGGTGTLGRRVVPRLQAAGEKVRILSRTSRHDPDVEYVAGDLSTGDGVVDALSHVNTVIHLAGTAKGDDVKARNLVEAASQVDVKHIVYISVVGADRTPVVSGVDRAMFGYIAAKRAAEEIIAKSGIPWTTVRATQFHDLMFMTALQMSKLPILPAPAGTRVQPVDTRDVADRVVELAQDEPRGLVADIAGPKTYPMAELFRSYVKAAGKRRAVVPVRMPGRAARAFRDGANLSAERVAAERTWEDFLVDAL